MTDLEEVPEEQDVTPSDDDGNEATTQDTTARSEAASDREGPANRWRSLAERMGDTLHKSDEDQDDAESEGADDEAGADEAGAAEQAEQAAGGEQGEQGDADEDDDEGAGKARYEIVDAQGDRLALELEKGTKIRFVADGKTVELDSMDQVVQLAQKGFAFDRVASQQGQANAELRRTVEALEAARKEDEELLLRIISDPAELEKVAAALEKYQDPEYRKGQEAIRENEARTEREKLAAATAQERAVNDFWGAVHTAINTDLSRYEYLDADDVGQITQDYYAQYEAKLGELVQQYTAIAPQHGLSQEEAVAQAQHDAAAILNERTLRQTMRALNEKYMRRAGKVPLGDKKAEARGHREITRHNAHVNGKREQRDSSRSMRSGGAPPANRPVPRQAPKTFEGKLQAGLARLRSIAGDDD